MRHIYKILADMIEEGRVVVDIPAVDMDTLEEMCNEYNTDILERVCAVVYDLDWPAEEKLQALKEILGEREEA